MKLSPAHLIMFACHCDLCHLSHFSLLILLDMQEVECLLEGGVATVTAAVERCLQFYVNAGAITRSTEESLRALLASLQRHS